MHYSFSSLKLFDQCPAQWKAVKLDKLYPFRSTPATEYGVRAHAAIEAWVKFKTPLPAEFAAYQWLVDDLLSQLSPNAVTEMPFDFAKDWSQVHPRKWADKHFNGSADLVDIVDGHALIADWKFGKVGSWKYADTDQLSCMALFVMKKNPEVQSVAGVLVFVNDAVCVPDDGSLRWTREDLPALEAEWMGKTAVVEQHLAMGAFPPKPNNLCSYCPHTVCDHHAPAVARREAKAARFQK